MVKYIREQVKEQNWIKLNEEQYCYVDQWVYMNTKGRDSDNLSKLLNDSITESEVVWLDDTYSLVRTQNLFIDAANPRVEMIISPVDFVGVFNTNEDYQVFKSKCESCKRYSKNCSIHRKLLENRIISEVTIVDNLVACNKYNKL